MQINFISYYVISIIPLPNSSFWRVLPLINRPGYEGLILIDD